MTDPGDTPPRYSGIRSFARLPQSRQLEGVDVAVVGVPFDAGTSFRPGARFGPEAIRSASALLRPYHPDLGLDVFGALDIVDWGDVSFSFGSPERAIGEIADQLAEIRAAGARTLVLGGDHLVALAELRAHAREQGGPVPLVLIDAHADTWDTYRGERFYHGTPFRRAVEEGVVDPQRSLMTGIRGPLYSAKDLDDARALGFELILASELTSSEEYGRRVRERIGDAPAFLSFDIDALDPAFAPATGTPEVAGLLPHDALRLLRSLAGISFCGFDVVEVSPAYDNPGQGTAILAANIAYEMLALDALAIVDQD